MSVHGEYGWATTITASQGATVDVGLVLVRRGIDREHLYVAMTRGREANHAYVTPDLTSEVDHHGPPPPGARASSPEDRAMDVLAAALARSGGKDAAHTARDHARTRVAEHARRAADDAARRAAEPVVPADHAARITKLTQRQTDSERLAREQQQHRDRPCQVRGELAETSRWHPGRRKELTAAIETHSQALNAGYPAAMRLDTEIETLTRQVEHDARQRQDKERAAARRTRPEPDLRQDYLAPAVAIRPAPRPLAAARAAAEHSRTEQDLRRIIDRHHQRRTHHSRGRDDSPGIGI